MRFNTIAVGLAFLLCNAAALAREDIKQFQTLNAHSGAGGTALGAGTITINSAFIVCSATQAPCKVIVHATVEIDSGGMPWSICVLIDGTPSVPACTAQPYMTGQFITGTFVGIAKFGPSDQAHKAVVQVKLASAGTLGGWSAIYTGNQ